MNYLLKSNRGKNRYKTPLLVVVIFAFVVFCISLIFPSFFPTLFTNMGIPLWKTEALVFEGAEGVFITKTALLHENAELKNKVQFLENENAQVAALKAENAELKELLGRRITDQTILAAVLRRPPLSPYDSLIIDIGSDIGISVGSKVYADGNILLGEIAEVNGKTAKVKLYSSAGEKYTVRLGDHGIEATATGKGGGNFEVILSRDVKVTIGDTVTIPSLSPTIFGVIGAKVSDPASVFSTFLFKNPVNMSDIRWVLVETQ